MTAQLKKDLKRTELRLRFLRDYYRVHPDRFCAQALFCLEQKKRALLDLLAEKEPAK